MIKRILFYIERIKSGRLKEMLAQTRWIYSYGKKYWKSMVFYTLIGLLGTIVTLMSGFISRDLINIITGHQTGKLIATFCSMIGLGIGSSFVNLISNYFSSKIGMQVDADIKADIFSKILETDWESLTKYHTGDLLTRWSSDASAVSSGVLNFIPNTIILTFRFISAFLVVLINDASFAIFAFLGMPVSMLLSKTIMKRMVANNEKSAMLSAQMSGFNQETFSNIQTIKAFDLIGLYTGRLKTLQNDYIQMRLTYQRMSMGISMLLSLVGMLVSYAAYGFGIFRVWSGAIDYGTMTMFLTLSGTLTGTLNSLTSLLPTAIALTTSAGRLMDILNLPREDFGQREEVHRFYEAHKEEGLTLRLKEVSYAYHNGLQVFLKTELEANPHEIVALIGPSGEGKTTMLRLLLSLVPPKEGYAEITAGEECMPLSPATRQLFSYVPQGNTLFSGTIAENLRAVKADASEEEIIDALKIACAYDFVQKLPLGIHSMVKERGGGFSEGQAQRLAIARALLRRSPLLLFDEATSALDVETEKKVLHNIMKDSYPRTCIVTTHRPTVLNMCDRVYRIQDKKCKVLEPSEVKEILKY